MIYIKVQTSFSSNFYLNTYINKKEFVDLIPGVTELIEIEENEVKNFIFQDINFDNEKE